MEIKKLEKYIIKKDKTDMLSSLKKVDKGFIDEKMEWYGANSIEKLSEKMENIKVDYYHLARMCRL